MLVRDTKLTYQFTHAERWTDGAIFCYKRGCKCEGCYIKELIKSSPCFMKHSVMKLVNELGTPVKDKYTKKQKDVIESILNGATTREEIALDLGISKEKVTGRLMTLYDIAHTDGWQKKKRKIDRLQEYIEWIRRKYDNV